MIIPKQNLNKYLINKNYLLNKMPKHYEMTTGYDTDEEHVGANTGDQESLVETSELGKIKLDGYMKFLGFVLIISALAVPMMLALTAMVVCLLGSINPLFGMAFLFPQWMLISFTVMFGLLWLLFTVLLLMVVLASLGWLDIKSWFKKVKNS